MKLKDRIKTYNFWVSLSSAIFLLLKVLGNQFGFNVDESLFSDIVTSLCGILVILGIIVPPTNKANVKDEQTPSLNTNTTIEDIKKDDLIIENNSIETKIDAIETSEVIEQLNENSLSENEISNESQEINHSTEDCTENINNFEINKLSPENQNLEIQDLLINENELLSNNENDADNISIKVAETLANQEKLFEGNSTAYIELLQNQINLLQGK